MNTKTEMKIIFMKKINAIFLLLTLSIVSACSDKEEVVIPSDIQNVRAEAREGSIMLRWDNPADKNFLYVPVEYVNPRTGKQVITNVSHFADSLLVKDLLAKDGEYTFKLRTVSESGGLGSQVLTVSCTALRRPIVTTEYSEKMDFEVSDLSANASDPSEGNLAHLIDGNLKTHYHTNWHEDVPFPQWIQFNLKEPVEGVKYISWNRDGSANGNADEVLITGSNDGKEWIELGRVLTDKLPTAGGAKFESPIFLKKGMTFTKIRYNAVRGNGGNPWFHIGELELHKAWAVIEDPEAE